MENIRRRIYLQFDTQAWLKRGLSPVNSIVAALVLASVVVVIVETEETISRPYEKIFETLNSIFLTIFIVEYITRIWVMGERAEYSGISGRIKFAFTLPALIDFLAIAPVFLGFFGSDTFLLRLLRLARILTLAKLGPFSTALVNLKRALASRSFELLVSVTITLGVLLISAIILYILEKDQQPEAFGSIPRAMWWAVATLTTVGYGDVYPITPLGKIFAGISALSSLGLVAMPAGILAGAFGEAFQKDKIRDEPE